MKRRRHTPEQIVRTLREAGRLLEHALCSWPPRPVGSAC
jgi:hypothetical protein